MSVLALWQILMSVETVAPKCSPSSNGFMCTDLLVRTTKFWMTLASRLWLQWAELGTSSSNSTFPLVFPDSALLQPCIGFAYFVVCNTSQVCFGGTGSKRGGKIWAMSFCCAIQHHAVPPDMLTNAASNLGGFHWWARGLERWADMTLHFKHSAAAVPGRAAHALP